MNDTATASAAKPATDATGAAKPKVPRRVAAVIINSLKGGVVPRIGLPYITVGRTREIQALLHDLDLLGPLQTPQFHLVDDRAVITWPDDVDRVLIHRPLMDKIVDRINALSAALKAHHGGKGVRLDG